MGMDWHGVCRAGLRRKWEWEWSGNAPERSGSIHEATYLARGQEVLTFFLLLLQ